MRLTMFSTDKTTQVINLSDKFFQNERGGRIYSLEIEQKARDLAEDILGENYFSHTLEFMDLNRSDDVTSYTHTFITKVK